MRVDGKNSRRLQETAVRCVFCVSALPGLKCRLYGFVAGEHFTLLSHEIRCKSSTAVLPIFGTLFKCFCLFLDYIKHFSQNLC